MISLSETGPKSILFGYSSANNADAEARLSSIMDFRSFAGTLIMLVTPAALRLASKMEKGNI